MFEVELGGGAVLRPLEPWQAGELLAHMERARETVDPWIPWASVNADLAGVTRTLQRYADMQARDEGRIYGIWLDGTLVGGTMFVAFDTKWGNGEIGCWLEPAAYGRGLITKAVRLLADWAFTTRGLHRIEWHCRTDNVASAAVARRVGMNLDGMLRESFHWHGAYHDMQIWSLLASEWPAS